MKSDAFLELRILSGTHAGARALLPEQPQVLGSGPDCDWILSDEGVLARHARLERQDDGSTALHWLEGGQAPLVIRPGEGVALGAVQIAIEPATAPWRTEVPACQAAQALDPADPRHALPSAAGASAAAPAGPGTAGARPPRARAATALAAAVGLGLLGAGIAWWGTHLQSTPSAASHEGAQAPAGAPRPAPGQGLDALRKVLADLDLSERVRLEPRDGLPPVVHAGLLSQDEAEALGAALSRLSPRPRLQLASAQDLQAAVADTLQDANGEAGRSLLARYLGEGRFRIEGRVPDDAAAASVLARLAERFPQVREFESALVTDASVAQALVEDLRAQGVQELSAQWGEGVLSLQVRLAPAAVPRWEQALQAAASRHAVPFRAQVELATPTTPTASLPASALPFSVRSIVSSGELPYVVLGNGDKLVQDGSVLGWRLAQVQARSVVFEGAQGRRVTLER